MHKAGKQYLKKADLDTAGTAYNVLINQLPEDNLEPVSTTGNVSTGKMDMFYGVAAANDADGGNFYISSTKRNRYNRKNWKIYSI